MDSSSWSSSSCTYFVRNGRLVEGRGKEVNNWRGAQFLRLRHAISTSSVESNLNASKKYINSNSWGLRRLLRSKMKSVSKLFGVGYLICSISKPFSFRYIEDYKLWVYTIYLFIYFWILTVFIYYFGPNILLSPYLTHEETRNELPKSAHDTTHSRKLRLSSFRTQVPWRWPIWMLCLSSCLLILKT